jgi:organic radical activating enzyme
MLHPPSAERARISEIFSSLQGEGPRVGERHLFIRFEECHIRCSYCDELGKAGREMTAGEVMDEVRRLEARDGPHAFVSLTGGEPLLYLAFLKPLALRLKADGFKIYLETDGILWRALEEMIALCDCVAMDMKPASVTGERNFDADHRRFLAIARAKETFVKIVVSREISRHEFDAQVAIMAELAPQTPLVLQPVSAGVEGHEDPVLMRLLETLQQRAAARLAHVRIVPRLHRILQIR